MAIAMAWQGSPVALTKAGATDSRKKLSLAVLCGLRLSQAVELALFMAAADVSFCDAGTRASLGNLWFKLLPF